MKNTADEHTKVVQINSKNECDEQKKKEEENFIKSSRSRNVVEYKLQPG
jgi:hypothetical protein